MGPHKGHAEKRGRRTHIGKPETVSWRSASRTASAFLLLRASWLYDTSPFIVSRRCIFDETEVVLTAELMASDLPVAMMRYKRYCHVKR